MLLLNRAGEELQVGRTWEVASELRMWVVGRASAGRIWRWEEEVAADDCRIWISGFPANDRSIHADKAGP